MGFYASHNDRKGLSKVEKSVPWDKFEIVSLVHSHVATGCEDEHEDSKNINFMGVMVLIILGKVQYYNFWFWIKSFSVTFHI